MATLLGRASRLVAWFLRPFASQEPSFYRAAAACLLAAGLFWQMNALNKTYTTRLECPLRWRYDTARYVALRPLPATMPVTVTGEGWRLLRANLGWGLAPAELRPVPRPGTRYLPAAAWRRGLRTALEGLQVNEWSGDTLRLTFDRIITRTLPLTVPGAPVALRVAPERLTFRGPASVLNALPNPYPLPAPPSPADPADAVEVAVPMPVQVRASTLRVRVQRVK